MQFIKIVVFSMLLGSTAFAGYATWRNFGAQKFEHPQGISLRQESVRAGFFPYYGRYRTHRGGGLSGGK
ncbi:MAG: hypothetical protein PVH87_08185 [Desulfobacteraceae bacterium]|jgi:hypothetical protein